MGMIRGRVSHDEWTQYDLDGRPVCGVGYRGYWTNRVVVNGPTSLRQREDGTWYDPETGQDCITYTLGELMRQQDRIEEEQRIDRIAEKYANPAGLKSLSMPVRIKMDRCKEDFVEGYRVGLAENKTLLSRQLGRLMRACAGHSHSLLRRGDNCPVCMTLKELGEETK